MSRREGFELGLWCLAALGCAGVIFAHPWTPWADQLALLGCAPRSGHYPAWSDGLSSCWASAAIASFAGTDPVRWNLATRVVASTLYFASTAALAHACLRTHWARLLVCGVLATSLFPFVWLSTELFAGAWLGGAVWLAVRGGSFAVAGLVLGLLAFAKPDLLLVAPVLLALQWRRAPTANARATLLGVFAAVTCVLLAPGVWQQGLAYLASTQRGWESFAQHADFLFLGGWMRPDATTRIGQVFPGAHSVWQAVTMHPGVYLDFLGRSAGEGWEATQLAFGPLLWCVPLVCIWALHDRGSPTLAARMFGASLVGVVPMLALSYPHARYLARYFPIALIVLTAVMEDVVHKPDRRWLRLATLVAFVGVSLVHGYHGVVVTIDALRPPPEPHFWAGF